MKKFEKGILVPNDYVKELPNYAEIWLNDVYQVIKYDAMKAKIQSKKFPAMWWLSIKRLDKEPIYDWRDLQRIKNMIVGAEHEAVQLFPAESRKVDTANQYHLFVLKDASINFPFGFNQRCVLTQADVQKFGAKQREL